MDPHSIFADPDPAVFLNAEFSVPVVEKKHKRLLKSKKNNGANLHEKFE